MGYMASQDLLPKISTRAFISLLAIKALSEGKRPSRILIVTRPMSIKRLVPHTRLNMYNNFLEADEIFEKRDYITHK